MNLLEVVILAVVQGLTEFLPVSSSGHLVVAAAVMQALGRQPPKDLVEVNIVLHLGTLLSVLVFYRRHIFRLLGADRRVIPLLIVGTLPLVVVGLGLHHYLPGALEDPLLAGLMFPLTGALLIWASRLKTGDVDYTQLSYRGAALIGLLQAVAALPGISRSGATISAGLIAGLRRDSAAAFAFLLAIPAISGAGVLEGFNLMNGSTVSTPVTTLLIGAAVAFVVGWFALVLLVRLVQRGRLDLFGYWLIPLGLVVIIWQLTIQS